MMLRTARLVNYNMITVSDIAAEKIQDLIARRGRGLGIRVGVKSTGCSGLAYMLEYVDTAPPTRDQFHYETNGVKIWVSGSAVPYINGLHIEWKKKGLNEGFEFVNPNEKSRCGCGESFRI